MIKGGWKSVGFLVVTGAAIGWELVASFDHDPNTWPWTDLIVHYVPPEITALILGGLIFWLPVHFTLRYWRGRNRPETIAPMTQRPPVELAAIGYRAYGKWVDNKNFRGEPMPDWEALPDPQRLAWIAAGQEIAREILAPPVPACACGHSMLFHDQGESGTDPPVCSFVSCPCGKTSVG